MDGPLQGQVSMTEDEFRGAAHTFHELHQQSMHQSSEFNDFGGIFEQHQRWQLRTGVIQDPRYYAFQNRYDATGALVQEPYSVLDPTLDSYPLGSINAIDNVGLRCSIVWLDGDDGGLYQDSNNASSLELPTQKVWLSFQTSWSDLDRSCGDFYLPISGTVVRVAMARGNVGVIVGTVPMDRGKLPLLRQGDFLRRAFNQNSDYITDQTVFQAINNVLNKDLYKPDPVIVPTADTETDPKPYETDLAVLDAVRNYSANWRILARDGVAQSTKLVQNKGRLVDGQRTFEITTSQSFSDAIDGIRSALQHQNVRSVRVVNTEGDLRVSQSSTEGEEEGSYNHKYVIEMNTRQTAEDALTMITSKFGTGIESIRLNSLDGDFVVVIEQDSGTV